MSKNRQETPSVDGTNKGFRMGAGAYCGLSITSRQHIKSSYNHIDSETIQKGDFNVNSLIYGVKTFIGYGITTLSIKYDINLLKTRNNIVSQ